MLSALVVCTKRNYKLILRLCNQKSPKDEQKKRKFGQKIVLKMAQSFQTPKTKQIEFYTNQTGALKIVSTS